MKGIQPRSGIGFVNMFLRGCNEARRPVAFWIILGVCICLVTELYAVLILDSQPPGVHLPISRNTSSSPCSVSPFCVIESKMFFMSTQDSYLFKPLAKATNHVFRLDLYISADVVSYSQVLIALLCLKLMISDTLTIRRVGCLLYFLRDFVDLLDGVVAKQQRSDKNIVGVKPVITLGYMIDGVCDGFACLFLVIASLYHLQRSASLRRTQTDLQCRISEHLPRYTSLVTERDDDSKSSGSSQAHWSEEECLYSCLPRWMPDFVQKCWFQCSSRFNITPSGRPAVLLLPLLLISSIFWNRNIIEFGKLLEPYSPTAREEEQASQLIHSPFMWTIFYAWKLINPLAICDALTVFIFFDMIPDFFRIPHHIVLFVIGSVAVVSEMYRYTILSPYERL